MKNKILHNLLVVSFFSLVFLISANPAKAGVVNLGPFCDNYINCAFLTLILIVTHFGWIILLLIGIVGLYIRLKTGKIYIGIISMILILIAILIRLGIINLDPILY